MASGRTQMRTVIAAALAAALAAAAYAWPTSETVPTFNSWLGPGGERTQAGTAGGAASIIVTTTGGGGGGGSSMSSQSGNWSFNGRVITGVNEHGTRYTTTDTGGTIYVLK